MERGEIQTPAAVPANEKLIGGVRKNEKPCRFILTMPLPRLASMPRLSPELMGV